jgi:hypothetical protein
MQSHTQPPHSIVAQHERWKFLVETLGRKAHPHSNEETLVRLYFSPKSFSESDLLDGCTRAAYGDFCRTLHGIGRLSNKDGLREESQFAIQSAILTLRRQASDLPPSEFEEWHRGLCEQLCNLYRDGGFPSFTIGQSQKWVNMTFKYIFSLGETWISGFGAIYPSCHAPLDERLLDALLKFGFPFKPERWSRISTYEEYLARQIWIREHFEIVPLDVEFLLWAGEEGKARAHLAEGSTPVS